MAEFLLAMFCQAFDKAASIEALDKQLTISLLSWHIP